jgi:hypothetical protein
MVQSEPSRCGCARGEIRGAPQRLGREFVTTTLAIEFHDATVHGIRSAGPDAVVEMTVYVHSSAGRPGFDAGVGWYQPAEMLLSDAVREQAPST